MWLAGLSNFVLSRHVGDTPVLCIPQTRQPMKSAFRRAACLLATATFTTCALAQDVEHGRKVYRTCLPCHVPDAYTNKLGPHLKGVFGRTAGSVSGFRYSQAMRDAGMAGLAWDEASLSEFLSSPGSKVPGTSMRFWGFWRQSDIDDVIAYLKTNP